MMDLIEAVRRGDSTVVESLLDRNPRALGCGDLQGVTPLMWAAFQGHPALVRLMLERGADATVRDERGTTALVLAAGRGHLEVVRTLVPLTGPDEHGEALRYAAGTGRIEAVVFLLDEAGAALEYGGRDGKTPLTCASLGGHAAVAEELLRRGADVEARSSTFSPLQDRDEEGWRPLHYAADRRHPLLVQLLLLAGAQVDTQSPEGTTPLMLAAHRGDEDVIRVLLRAGADPLRQHARQGSALSLARGCGKPVPLQLLEAAAATRRYGVM